MRTRKEKILLAAGMLCAAAAAFMPLLVVPKFRETFEGFGVELPFLTKLFTQYSLLFWLLPVSVLIAWLYWPKANRRALASLLIGAISLVLMVPALIGAMYLPIFKLGSA